MTALGSLAPTAAPVSIPGVSQLLGGTPLDPVGWAQALGSAAAVTLAIALAIGVGHALASNHHNKVARELGEALETA